MARRDDIATAFRASIRGHERRIKKARFGGGLNLMLTGVYLMRLTMDIVTTTIVVPR